MPSGWSRGRQGDTREAQTWNNLQSVMACFSRPRWRSCATGPLLVREVLREVSERVTLTPYELARYRGGQGRWDVAVRFLTGDATTLGWMSKLGGWTLTEAGSLTLWRD